MRQHPVTSQHLFTAAGLTTGENKSFQLSKEQTRMLQTLHGDFTPALESALCALLLTPAVTLASLQDIASEAFTAAQPVTSYPVSFSALTPHAGLLECSESIALLIVDRLLGGNGAMVDSPHALSEIEMQLLHSALEPLLAAYAKMWQRTIKFSAKLEGTTDELPAGETLYVATYEIYSLQGSGQLQIVLRLPAWQEVLSRPGAAQQAAPAPHSPNAGMLEIIGDCSVSARALLGRTHISVSELLSMSTGDIICLDNTADSPVEVHINNRPKLLGRAQVQNDQFVVFVEGPMARGRA